jgi:hypothetical protein
MEVPTPNPRRHLRSPSLPYPYALGPLLPAEVQGRVRGLHPETQDDGGEPRKWPSTPNDEQRVSQDPGPKPKTLSQVTRTDLFPHADDKLEPL